MRTIFNEEFGWFKKDSTLKKDKIEKKSSKVRVDWDDARKDQAPEIKKVKEPVKKKTDEDDLPPSVEWDN